MFDLHVIVKIQLLLKQDKNNIKWIEKSIIIHTRIIAFTTYLKINTLQWNGPLMFFSVEYGFRRRCSHAFTDGLALHRKDLHPSWLAAAIWIFASQDILIQRGGWWWLLQHYLQWAICQCYPPRQLLHRNTSIIEHNAIVMVSPLPGHDKPFSTFLRL